MAYFDIAADHMYKIRYQIPLRHNAILPVTRQTFAKNPCNCAVFFALLTGSPLDHFRLRSDHHVFFALTASVWKSYSIYFASAVSVHSDPAALAKRHDHLQKIPVAILSALLVIHPITSYRSVRL